MKKTSRTKSRTPAVVFPVVALLLTICACGLADKLHHVDGTVVSGKIKSETPDEVTIETKYGPLTYEKTRLLKIERDEDAVKAAAVAAQAAAASKAKMTPVNYTSLLPAGPINPFQPPSIPALAKYLPASLRATTASLAAAAAATGAAGAKATPTPTPQPVAGATDAEPGPPVPLEAQGIAQ